MRMITNALKTMFAEKTTAYISGTMQNLIQIAASKVGFKLSLKATNKSAEVKLVGGSGPHEGNIFVGGAPVCDDYHDADNAHVVCRSNLIQLFLLPGHQ